MMNNYKNNDDAKVGETKLIEELIDGELYVDTTFSINKNFKLNRINLYEIYGCYEPIQDFSDIKLCQFFNGRLYDNWIINGLQFLLNHKLKLLENVFITNDNHKYGIYTIKLFHNNEYQYFHVDDRIPCDSLGIPLFSRTSNPNNIWIYILEKAIAKCMNGYENLLYGSIYDLIILITGYDGILLNMKIENNNVFWSSLSHDLNNNKTMVIGVQKLILPNSIINLNLNYEPDKIIVIKDIYEIITTSKQIIRLILLYDSYKEYDLNSIHKWSYKKYKFNEKTWNHINDALQLNINKKKHKSDGLYFYIELSDFLNIFNKLYKFKYCKESNNHVYFYDISYDISNSGGNPINLHSWLNNPMYLLKVKNSNTKLSIMFKQNFISNKKLFHIGIQLYKHDKRIRLNDVMNNNIFPTDLFIVHSNNYESSTYIILECELDIGSYVIVPSTYELKEYGSFNLIINNYNNYDNEITVEYLDNNINESNENNHDNEFSMYKWRQQCTTLFKPIETYNNENKKLYNEIKSLQNTVNTLINCQH